MLRRYPIGVAVCATNASAVGRLTCWGAITKKVAFDQKNIGKPIFLYVIGDNVLIYEKKG